MKKNNLCKLILSLFLATALIAGLIVSPATPGIETSAADKYVWVLTSSKCELNETKVEQFHKNYFSQYTPTTAGMIGMKHSGGYYDTSSWSHCDRYYECQIPASTLATGANVSLRMTLKTDNVSCKTSGYSIYSVSCSGCSVYLGDYSYNPFKDQSGEKELYIGTAAGRPYTDKNITVTKTVSNTMPESTSEGAATIIHFDNGAGTYIWTYTLKKASSSKPKKPAKGVVSKITNVKGAKARITVKKVKGAAKYSIRVTTKKDKKGTVHTSKTNTFTIKMTKGSTFYVEARVKNSAGWGPYGSKKSFKTDTK